MTVLKRVPEGPKGSWLSGNLPDFRRDRLDFLTRCSREFGDFVRIRLAHRTVFLATHPDVIEEVLLTHSKHFIKHFALRLNPLALGKGLLTSESDFWLRQRRLIQPVFHRTRVASYGATMVEHAQRMIANWKPGEQRDMMTEMMAVTLAIAAKTLFNAEVGDETRTVVEALQVLQDNFLHRFNSLMPPPLWLPTPGNLRIKRAVRRLDDIIYGFIRQRRAERSDKGDLLSLLLNARDESDGTGMTDTQVRDEAMTLFLAGHETTALTLSWTWYLMAQHPEAEQRLWAELDTILAGRAPMVDDWPKLKFTEAIALESMRLYPPAYVIGREATSACVIAGHDVPKGTTVLMPQWVVQRDPRFYTDPDAFRPERWLDERIKTLPKFAYFPFGGGPRVCIGQQFAMMELVLILATIAQKFRFRLQPGAAVAVQPTFTLRPVPGVPGVVEPRMKDEG